MDNLVAQLRSPGMSLTDEGANYARRMKQEADDSELAALFCKAMTGVQTAGTKKPKGKGKGKAKQRTPVKFDRNIIQPGQLDQAVERSRAMARQRGATGRSRQVADRRGLRIEDPNDLSESMGKMGMGMPRRKSRRKSRKSRRKSRKSRRKSRKSRRKSESPVGSPESPVGRHQERSPGENLSPVERQERSPRGGSPVENPSPAEKHQERSPVENPEEKFMVKYKFIVMAQFNFDLFR